jgi:hypothetical protein
MIVAVCSLILGWVSPLTLGGGPAGLGGTAFVLGVGVSVLSLMGCLVVGAMRWRLVRSRHLAPTLAYLKAIHAQGTGEARIRVVPLARVSNRNNIFELER